MAVEAQRSARLELWRRSLTFVALFFALQIGWHGLRGTSVEYAIVHGGTVVPAAYFINLLTPNAHAQAVEFNIRAAGDGLRILNGCEGLEALFLLLAAFAVAPVSWSARAWGLLFGGLIVFVVNQARILVLFYAYRADHSLFDQLHGSVAPITVILIVSGYFYAWLLRETSRAASTS